jgi:hypothetical protein
MMRLSTRIAISVCLPFVTFGSFMEPAQAKSSEPSAICRDNTYSYSTSRSGTCSGHGGVSEWCPCKRFQKPPASGTIKYKVRGNCLKADEDLIEIVEGETTSCSLFLVSSKSNRSRKFQLQYYDEEYEEWISEDTVEANLKGTALLQVADIWTPDGECYDDTSFLYRIISEKTSTQKRLESNEIQVDFYSSCGSDW